MMINLKNISKKLGDFAISDINLQINAGEYFVILGPTGSGKTVLLELIAGICKLDKGNIFIKQKDVSTEPIYNRKIGLLYQDYMLFNHFSVRENIAYSLKLQKKSKKYINEKVEKICDLFNISHILNRYPEKLSGGEKQRVALARTLISNPEIILLDEPFSALDIVTKNKLIREIKQIHQKEKINFIHVTHDFEEAIVLADRICVIDKGKILQVGTPDEIFKKPASKFVANFVDARNIYHAKIDVLDGLKVAKIDDVDLNIFVNTEKDSCEYLTIRPEDIILSNERFISSARNNFFGKITNILLKKFVCEITVDIGVEIVAFVTNRSILDLDLKIGKDVWVTFKATEVHVL